ncbi:uncharacterized protein METZ01_LOCUS321793, partial [marine metagenome]
MLKENTKESLYHMDQVKDNCGFGLMVNRHGVTSRKVVIGSISGLNSMTHRGAIGSDGKTGDGCGLLFDLNKRFFKKAVKKEVNIDLPENFGIAQIFSSYPLKRDFDKIRSILQSEGLVFFCSRQVPIDKSILGEIALNSLPFINQIFIIFAKDFNKEQFESSLLQARKKIEEIYDNDEKLYVCSMSC